MNRTILALGLLSLATYGCGEEDGGGRDTGGGSQTGASAEGGTGGGTESATGAGTDGTSASAGDASGDGSADGTSGADGPDDGSTSGASASATTSGTSGSASATTFDDTADDGGEESSTGAVEPCEVMNPNVSFDPPNLLFVLDKSGSMTSSTWDHDNDGATPVVTRWNTLHEVVTFIVQQYEDRINFGAKLYPTVDGCNVNPGVEVPVMEMNANNIIAGIPLANASFPGGALTPPEQGIGNARDYLAPLDPGKPRSMMLVMDGNVHSSCGTPAGLTNLLNTVFMFDNIPTYLVGIDISAGLVGDMNTYANAGGVPKPGGGDAFYNAGDMAELQAAMDAIAADVLTCTIDLDPEPDFPNLMKVIVDGMEWPEVTDCTMEDGWIWTQQYNQIELCGMACDDYKLVETAEVEYYCIPG